jgi:hypothetical protein
MADTEGIPGQHVRWIDQDGYSNHGTFIAYFLGNCVVMSTHYVEFILDPEIIEWYDPEAYPLNLEVLEQ